jgi:hypothetical protein
MFVKNWYVIVVALENVRLMYVRPMFVMSVMIGLTTDIASIVTTAPNVVHIQRECGALDANNGIVMGAF